MFPQRDKTTTSSTDDLVMSESTAEHTNRGAARLSLGTRYHPVRLKASLETQAFPHECYSCKCHTVVPIRSTVYRDPKAVKGNRRRTEGGQMGGSPKAPTAASGRGNQPAGGDPESNRGCPGPRDIKRDGHNRLETSVKPALSISSRAKVQS